MIELSEGNLLKCNAEALVNTVNCVGVMGKGIALQFKKGFPDNFKAYEKACKKGEVRLGKMFVYHVQKLGNPKFIINFPTKGHWKAKSRLKDIENGLKDLEMVILEHDIKSIALPPLGCGNGGLDWDEVEPLIQATFAKLPADIHVHLYAPKPPRHEPLDMVVNTKVPNMTRAKALLVKLIDLYQIDYYSLTQIEVQKLAYFLQISGEPLKLEFVRGKYGPYANTLHFLLQNSDGHYITGYGDRSTETSQIRTLPEGRRLADEFLSSDAEAKERLSRLSRLIEGFETPYGMELLATVHWLAREKSFEKSGYLEIVRGIQEWNERKGRLFTPPHVKAAWDRLKSEGWLDKDPFTD